MHKFRPATSLRFTRFCLAVSTLSGVAALGLGGQTAWADTSCTAPNNGPTGPAAATFTYQCDGTYAGDWTNSYYIYNPTTGTQTALYSPDYSYDCTTNTWTQAEWDYDAGSGAYVESRVAATAPPDQPTNCVTADNKNTASSGTGSASTGTATAPDTSAPTGNSTAGQVAATAPPDPNTACPAPGGTNPGTPAAGDTTNNSVTINNTVCSQSQSGDAGVTNNGQAGNATSGNAMTEVSVANLVQTLSNVLGPGVVTFTQDIGDMNGNLVLDPSAFGVAGADPSNQPANADGTVNTDAAITNTITATAASGDATVSGNGNAGNATSGNAEAIVNLINMINSAVAAGHSFIGTININGDLNGNILIPQSVVDQLLAWNAGQAAGPGNGAASVNNNESITNNVTASATSGNASVTGNGVGGNATSGNAGTNVTIMNLTGSSIIGKNVLLVFVNVLGQWVGMIVNAPAGATSAEFGGSITSDTPGTGNGVIESGANLSITNNVTASATSGNASVTGNGVGGNATSGNAKTAVNILNVEDSELSLANWFGILFINVFGTWNGSFGIQPTPTPAAPSSTDTGSGFGAPQVVEAVAHPAAYHFATFLAGGAPAAADSVLGDATSAPLAHKIETDTLPASTSNSAKHTNYLLPILGVGLAALLLAGAERDRIFGNK